MTAALVAVAFGLLLLGVTIHTWAYWSEFPSGVVFEPAPPSNKVQLLFAAGGALVLIAAVSAAALSRRRWVIVITGIALLATVLGFVTIEQSFLRCLISGADCSILVNTG
jgi:hypothetical protein